MMLIIIKIMIVLTIIFNCFQLIAEDFIQNQLMQYISFINFQKEMLPIYAQWLTIFSATAASISGWMVCLICSCQCSSLITLISSSPIPYIMTSMSLIVEGLILITMSYFGRLYNYTVHPSLALIALASGFLAVYEREKQMKRELNKRAQDELIKKHL